MAGFTGCQVKEIYEVAGFTGWLVRKDRKLQGSLYVSKRVKLIITRVKLIIT